MNHLILIIACILLFSASSSASNCRNVLEQYDRLTLSQKADAILHPNRRSSRISREAQRCKRSRKVDDLLATGEHQAKQKIDLPTAKGARRDDPQERARENARRRAQRNAEEFEKRRRQDALERFCRDNRHEEFCD